MSKMTEKELEEFDDVWNRCQEAIKKNAQEYEKLNTKIQDLREELSEVVKDRDGLILIRQKLCEHPEDQNYEKPFHVSGGYYSRSYSVVETKCRVCDKVLNSKTTYGGYE